MKRRKPYIAWDTLTPEDIRGIIAHFKTQEAQYQWLYDLGETLWKKDIWLMKNRQEFWAKMLPLREAGAPIKSLVTAYRMSQA